MGQWLDLCIVLEQDTTYIHLYADSYSTSYPPCCIPANYCHSLRLLPTLITYLEAKKFRSWLHSRGVIVSFQKISIPLCIRFFGLNSYPPGNSSSTSYSPLKIIAFETPPPTPW